MGVGVSQIKKRIPNWNPSFCNFFLDRESRLKKTGVNATLGIWKYGLWVIKHFFPFVFAFASESESEV